MNHRSLKDMRSDQVRHRAHCERTIERMIGQGLQGSPEYWEWVHNLYRTQDVIKAIDRCIDVFGAGSTDLDRA